ncbi:isochorismatase family cysteine hydrolase [Nonomuraea sp. NPDC001023]|uniref:cysteine hydrolase family protein n=1 Tax=Nonomuraea sp. NPDC001023 TaxID=3154770 RepID=UPI00331B2030
MTGEQSPSRKERSIQVTGEHQEHVAVPAAEGHRPVQERAAVPAEGHRPVQERAGLAGEEHLPGTERAALVVVDLQNDFCTGPTARARYAGDPAALETVAANTARALASARARGMDVVFVRFVGDAEHQGPSWRRRDLAQGKPLKCLEGTWGAQFHKVEPAPGEPVFTKWACFDAFLSEGFERHLRGRGIVRLVFAGLYTDVCVDSTARTAFQKGFHITVLTDCTASRYLPDSEILRFMAALYGAHLTSHDVPGSWIPEQETAAVSAAGRPAREESTCRTTDSSRSTPASA